MKGGAYSLKPLAHIYHIGHLVAGGILPLERRYGGRFPNNGPAKVCLSLAVVGWKGFSYHTSWFWPATRFAGLNFSFDMILRIVVRGVRTGSEVLINLYNDDCMPP